MSAKRTSVVAFLILSVVALASFASAAITIDEVEFDDDSLGDGTNVIRDIESGETFTVKVHVTSDEDIDDVQVEAYIRGYDHDDRVEDISDVFDMKANVSYVKKLEVSFPQRIDDDSYQLRVRVEGRNGASAYNDYDLEIDGARHDIAIRDVIFSPEGAVKAGRAILASVRVSNYGEKDEDSVKVQVSVPDLGVSASDYIDELEAGESTTSEELYLRIPTCAEAGVYDVDVRVSYDDGDEVVTDSAQITVTEDETCGAPSASGAKPTIVYDAASQDLTAGGQGAVYAITIANPTNAAKTVAVSVSGVDVFGSAKVSPSNVIVVGAGETKTVYVYVTADKDAKAGQYGFTASIAGLSASTQDIALAANVKAKSGVDTVTALEIGLVVLIIILVILGIIFGYRKMNEGNSDETQTYY